MGFFAPPLQPLVPQILDPSDPDYNPVANRLRRFASPGSMAYNVYLYRLDGVLYATPVAVQSPWQGDGTNIAYVYDNYTQAAAQVFPVQGVVERTIYGSHAAQEVNAEETAALEAAGYTVIP